jgi:Trypsin-like peptidase domain
LTCLLKDKVAGYATGFFFLDKGTVYLVTNKHVIYGKMNYGQDEIRPIPEIDALRLNLHTNIKNSAENEEVTISLFDNERKLWLEHYLTGVDVVLIPLAIDRKKYLFSTISREIIDIKDIVVDDFEKIFVMGYPHGWYDRFNNFPVARVGHLSSPFKVHFQGLPMMMDDVITHEGMSGGPVFMRLVDFITQDGEGKKTRLLGSTRYIFWLE